jgi:lysophospholipase L1-like esterase
MPHKAAAGAAGGAYQKRKPGSGTGGTTQPVVTWPTTSTPHLPFDMPTRATLRAVTSRQVYAHWFTQFGPETSVSYADQYWMPPGGTENFAGAYAFAPYGGFIRDRPLTAVRTGTQAQQYANEIAAMKGAGLDGFAVDGLTNSNSGQAHWQNQLNLISAMSTAGDCDYQPMPDGTAQFTQDGATLTDRANNCANHLNTLMGYSAIQRVGTKYAFGVFAPENVQTGSANIRAYWDQVHAQLLSLGKDTVQFNCYQSSPFTDPNCADTFQSASYLGSHGRWGDRAAQNATGAYEKGLPVTSAQRGTPWYGYVAPQDNRYTTKTAYRPLYWESGCFDLFRENWRTCIDNNVRLVQIPTWNDLSEHASVCPTLFSGYTWLDLMAWYVTRYKMGQFGTRVRDVVYLGHRIHRTDLATTAFTAKTQTNFVTVENSTPVNNVEALVALTGPATVTVTVNGAATVTSVTQAMIDASWDKFVSIKVPHPVGATGKPTVTITRNGATVVSHTSPYAMSVTPQVQDVQYKVSTSGRSTTDLTTATPSATVTPIQTGPLPTLNVTGAYFTRADNGQRVWVAGGNFMSHEHRGTTSIISAGMAAMRAAWGGNYAHFGVAADAINNNTPHPYTATPYLTLMDQIKDAGKANGCYVNYAIRSKGIENRIPGSNPTTYDVDGQGGQYNGIPGQEAIDALAKLAARYINETHVMFSCQVETHGSVTWAQARAYYQACVDAVRATGSKAIVMTSGLDYGRTINDAVTSPVTGTNVCYKTHMYELQSSWAQFFTGAVDAGLPVFFGEMGQPLNFGGYAQMTQVEVDAFFTYIRTKTAGWAGWAFEADQSPRMVTEETNFTPTDPFGVSCRDEMLSTPAIPGDARKTVTPTPRGVTATATSDTTVTLAYSAVTGATSYEYRLGSSGTPVSLGTALSSTITVNAGTTSVFQVRANISGVYSAWSPSVTVTNTGGANISRGRPITASAALTYGASPTILLDGQWDADAIRTIGFPLALTIDLSGVSAAQRGPSTFAWNTDLYTGDTVLTSGETYNALGAYQIQASTSATGTYTTLLTVTGNTRKSRTHRVDLTGYTFFRFNLTAGQSTNNSQNIDAVLSKLELVSGNADLSVMLFGDSITTAWDQASYGLGSAVEAAAPTKRPIFEQLGAPGYSAYHFASGTSTPAYRTQWLKYLSETACKYVNIDLGTNDASNGVQQAAPYEANMRSLIADVKAQPHHAGGFKIPIVPTIPWANTQTQNDAGVALNARLNTIYGDTTGMLRGPDQYTYFFNNQSLMQPANVHPTTAGYAAMAQNLWAPFFAQL